MKRDEDLVIVEQGFDRSASDVWNAITDIVEMRKWYFENIPAFKAESGFRTQFPVESGDRVFLHLWEVTEVIPRRKVVYNWKFAELEGECSSSFEVMGDDLSARLTVIIRVRKDFSDDIPEFTRESCIGGWNYFINDRLKTYLDGS